MNAHRYLLGIIILFSSTLKSQVVINEIASRGTIIDANGEQSDWIELYNAGATPVNL